LAVGTPVSDGSAEFAQANSNIVHKEMEIIVRIISAFE